VALATADLCAHKGLRVVHVVPSTDDAGAENQARYLLAALRDAGVDLRLAFFRPGRAHDRFEQLGIPLHELGARGPLLIDARRRARRLIAVAAGADLIHTWLYEAAVVGALAVRAARPPRLVIAQRSGTALGRDRARMLVLRLLRRRVDQAIANSEDGSAILLRAGYDADRVSMVGNALPADRVTPRRRRDAVRAELGVRDADQLVCTVARMDDAKDLPGLMRAMAIVTSRRPAARLLLVGVDEAELSKRGVQPPADAVVIGWQPHPADLMAASDVVAISSWSEGHSNVADEALMLGLPVASTDVGAHPRLVARSGGRVVPPRDPHALAAAIVELLDQPPPRERVREAAQSELAPAAALEFTLGIYERALGMATGPRL
jgi:glycosyltransferase involved in cell wall biosynthesis